MQTKIKKTLILVFLCGFFGSLCPAASVFGAINPDELPIPSEWIRGEPCRLDASFVISVGSVLKKRTEKQGVILVDVRKRDAFEKFRIPGSLNMPLFGIKTKTFLRNKSLVLINEGYSCARLVRECRRLREQGFTRAAVMFGGLWSWKQQGGPMDGDVFSQETLNQVTAADFFEQRGLQNQVVVNISEKADRAALDLIPRTVFVPYGKKDPTFSARMKDALRPSGHDPLSLILIYNRDGRYPMDMVTLMRKSGVRNFYLLKDGIKGYRNFIRKQARIRQKRNEKIIIRKCPTCP